MAVMVTLGILFALANAIAIGAYLRGRKSASKREENAAFFWEYVYAGLRDPARITRQWVRQAYGDDFTLRRLMLVVFFATFAVLGLLAEFYFLQMTMAIVLNESPETPAIIGAMKFSHLLALFICAASVIAGLLAFDASHSFWKKLFAWNVLGMICLIEAYFGYTRAAEFTILGSLQAALQGGDTPTAQPLAGFSLANAALGFINPLLAALTAGFLISLVTWSLASAIAITLFIFLWLPTWITQAIVAKRRGAWRSEEAASESEAAANETDDVHHSPGTGSGEHRSERSPAAERAEEDQERLRELEEAERRRRDQAHAHPFA